MANGNNGGWFGLNVATGGGTESQGGDWYQPNTPAGVMQTAPILPPFETWEAKWVKFLAGRGAAQSFINKYYTQWLKGNLSAGYNHAKALGYSGLALTSFQKAASLAVKGQIAYGNDTYPPPTIKKTYWPEILAIAGGGFFLFSLIS